ncbi:hypothetical protein LC613_35240 [Nostoc sphaeroides CHAB 2801]|nr:hypothetical protein [Nostoc sphaeroides]MCC5632812.1 hypothetical protein [Nostoc sphaeroides CHAB 2801]
MVQRRIAASRSDRFPIPATAIAIQKLNSENTTQTKGDRQLNPTRKIT